MILELSKIRITLFSTLTTMAGYVFAAHQVDPMILISAAGVLLLACGSAVLNQIQERHWDAKMVRTKMRPLPSGRISFQAAVVVAVLFLLAGSIVLWIGVHFMAFGLGLLAVLWYNGVYTYLKHKTAFAVVPGALIGAIPPVIGWVAGGGAVFDPKILIFSFFFFVWQVPHFWLLMLIYGDDYQQAGFPSLSAIFTREQLQRITFIWIFAAAVACLIIPLFGLVQNSIMNALLVIGAFWMIGKSAVLLGITGKKRSFGMIFRDINIYALVVIIVLTINRLLQ